MQLKKQFLATFLAAILLCSCSPKTYFTQGIRQQIENNKIAINSIQFYIDKPLELSREISTDTIKNLSGKIVFENGKYLQIIKLRRFTPGVCTSILANKLSISFDQTDEKFLTFGLPKNYSTLSHYQLYVDNIINNIIKVNYQGKVFDLHIDGNVPRLLIDKSNIVKDAFNKRVVTGRRI
jgi:hypothetical protein